jgi:hypothetical protein
VGLRRFEEARSFADHIIHVADVLRGPQQWLAQPVLALFERPLLQIFAIEEQQIEREISQAARVGAYMQGVETGGAVRIKRAELAIEIGGLRRQLLKRSGNGGITACPIRATSAAALCS